MTERFLAASPPAPDQLALMDAFVSDQFRAAAPEFRPGANGFAAAVGGTITALAALHLGAWDPDRVHGMDLTAARISTLSSMLAALPSADIASLPGMEPKRADIITAGAGIYVCLMRAFGLARLRVSLHDIRHGVLQALLSGAWDAL